MKSFTSYRRVNADTINGEKLIVSTIYTTFDSEEMEKFEESIRNTIKSGIMVEYEAESEGKTTCENCIYSNECIMYDPAMKRCKDYKESEV